MNLFKGFFASAILLTSFSVVAATPSTTSVQGQSVTSQSTGVSPVTVFFKSESTNSLERAKTIGGVRTENQAKLIYNFSDKLGAGLLACGVQSFANSKENQSDLKFEAKDLAAVTTFSTAGIFGADVTLLEGRIYAPTSEGSQKHKLATQLRMDLVLPKALGHGYTASLYFSPRAYVMGAGASHGDFQEAFTSIKAQHNYTKKFDVYFALDHDYITKDKDAKFARAIEKAGPEIGTDWEINPYVKLSLDVEQMRNLSTPTAVGARSAYALFDTNETNYKFTANLKY